MGITIDETIYCMASYLPSDDYTHCTECKYYGCKDNKTCASSEAHQKSIDIMRKYQQIEQIVSDFRKYQKGITWGFGGEKYMQMVSEVIEDENDTD